MGRAPKRARSGWRARYEPWHDGQLEPPISRGKRHIVKVAVVALYAGQRRADVIGLCENQIREGVWSIEQGKTGTR